MGLGELLLSGVCARDRALAELAHSYAADEAPHVVEAEPAEEQHHISGVSPAVGGRATDRKGNGDDDDDEDGSGGVGVGRDVEVAPSPENAAPAVAVAAALARSPKVGSLSLSFFLSRSLSSLALIMLILAMRTQLPHRRGQSSMMGYPLWSAQRNSEFNLARAHTLRFAVRSDPSPSPSACAQRPRPSRCLSTRCRCSLWTPLGALSPFAHPRWAFSRRSLRGAPRRVRSSWRGPRARRRRRIE
jgi:hypothetical protein